MRFSLSSRSRLTLPCVALTVNLLSGAVCGQVAFNPLEHSGPASPYFDAPSQSGIQVDTPAGCVVDQAAYIVRHGARYPEPGSFASWQSLFSKIQNASFTARGPLSFLPSWVPPVDDASHEIAFLSATGAAEAFGLGVGLRKRYGFTSGGGNLTVWSASQQRVLDTASYFLRGYLSQGSYLGLPTENRGTVVSLPDSVNFTFANSLTPTTSCPAFATGDTSSARANAFRASFQGAIAKRINKFLDGLQINSSDVGVMQDLCGFQAEINGDTRFCDVFQPSEWLDYEYADDLNYYYGSGPGNPFSGATGFPLLKAITDLFVLGPDRSTPFGSFVPPPLLMGFTHDNDLPPVISALGIWNDSDVSPLSPTTPNPKRHFRSSYLVAFRGYIALERLSCGAPEAPTVRHIPGQVNMQPGARADAAKFVRIRVNTSPVPVPECTSGPGLTCPLENFAKYVAKRGESVGDYITTCGLQDVSNATGTADFFTNIPAGTAMLLL
ncbi:phosphoglycerate mutase-like protein [Auriscalpium vulgare]|uniref:Phosphoglycerate mutase-like protein n=1 Tax=Auriscalpium vulgare TaxID=40419 RepID=A0ACB8S3I9_9AGAM|nr:phosphoglycerate mutase-like protein [Auriscalpium vulgare]